MRMISMMGMAMVGIAAAGVLVATPGATQGTGDAVKGKATFARCMACHTATAPQNKLGPSLMGVVGRKAGTYAGFNYSPAMKGANIAWTPANLDAYLANPKAKVPGNKMIFAGLPKPEDRANVIAYLANPK